MKQKTILLLFLALLLIGCSGLPATEEGAEPVVQTQAALATNNAEVTAVSPANAAASRIVQANGQLVAVQPVVTLSFETNGRLLTLNVQPGDRVEAGDVMATLEASALQDTVTSAALQVAQSENSLAQSQLALDDLLNWKPNETAVSLAEANLAAAQASLDQTQTQVNSAGSNLTSANVAIAQAERALTDAQTAYDTAHDPGRDWEIAAYGGNPPPLEMERTATVRAVQEAQEALSVARAQWSVTASSLTGESAVTNAEAAIVSAQQTLELATTGPTASAIETARLQVEQAEIALEQSLFAQQQAEKALSQAQLITPVSGAILSVTAAAGTTVGAGSPIVALLDTTHLEFHTSNLSERDLAQIQAGQTAQIRLKSYPNALLPGTVVRIASQSSGMVGDAAAFTVMIRLDDTDIELRDGMTGQVEITGS